MSEHRTNVPKNIRNGQAPDYAWDESGDAAATILWMESPSEFKAGFVARVRRARKATGWNQREMAEVLGIPLKNYEAYESRVLLPHHLIWQFTRAARIPLEYLYTGRLPPEFARSAPERAARLVDRRRRRRRDDETAPYGNSESRG